jgi:hypothetical protein
MIEKSDNNKLYEGLVKINSKPYLALFDSDPFFLRKRLIRLNAN